MHTIGSISSQAADMLKRCADAGHPVPVATIVVSAQAAAHVKALSPKTLTVVRPVWPDNLPTVNGRVKFTREWYESYLWPIKGWLKDIDLVKWVNEKYPGNKQADRQILEDFRDFYWELGRACWADGIGYTVLDLAAGNMGDDRHAPEMNQFEIMRPMLEWISTHGGVLNAHCYNPLIPQHVYNPLYDPENWVLRPVHWLEQIPTLKLVSCEYLVPEWSDSSGRDAVLPGDSADVVRMMRQVDGLWNGVIQAGRIRPEQFLGLCGFTDNAGDRWSRYNMNPHLAAQAEYLING